MGADQRRVKVESSTLRAKANSITSDYPSMSTSAAPPCMLIISGLAMQRLDQNYQQLIGALTAGKAEAARLAACLQAAAHSYDEADARGKASIESGGTPSGTDPVPVNPDLPPPAPKAPIGKCTTPPEDQGIDWTTAVEQFDAGDQGSSLLDFTNALRHLADQLNAHGKKFSMGDTHWEGGAAEAAEGALRRHESWLYDIAQQTLKLADQANDFADAHISEHPKHPSAQDIAQVNQLTGADWLTAYSAKQEQSDEVRRSYASRVDFADMAFKEPPAGAYPSQPVSAGDVAPDSYLKQAMEKTRKPDDKSATGPGGGGGPSGGGGQPSGGSPPAEPPSAQPAAAPEEAKPQESGGEKPGGESGGGSPSGGEGGGSPSGGEGSGSGGGLPDGLGDDTGLGSGTGLPDDGGLKPAAAGVGGGGAGGGLGGQPLQPAASAPAMGTSAASAGAGPGGASGGGAGGGSMGGGMGGGMGGMGHGGNREGGKEKKRNPNLSADEALYVEDRPFTDPVIGHTRRTKIEDKKEPK